MQADSFQSSPRPSPSCSPVSLSGTPKPAKRKTQTKPKSKTARVWHDETLKFAKTPSLITKLQRAVMLETQPIADRQIPFVNLPLHTVFVVDPSFKSFRVLPVQETYFFYHMIATRLNELQRALHMDKNIQANMPTHSTQLNNVVEEFWQAALQDRLLSLSNLTDS